VYITRITPSERIVAEPEVVGQIIPRVLASIVATWKEAA
jgi:hypothetical protein